MRRRGDGPLLGHQERRAPPEPLGVGAGARVPVSSGRRGLLLPVLSGEMEGMYCMYVCSFVWKDLGPVFLA